MIAMMIVVDIKSIYMHIYNQFIVLQSISRIMGGGGHHTHYVYNPPVYKQVGPTNEEIQAQIRRQQQEAAAAQAQAQRKAQQLERTRAQMQRQRIENQRIQRQNFARAEKLQFQQYLQNLGMMDLKAYIPKIQKGEKHYAVIGPISSGKTTFLNSIFNIKEVVGLGQATTVAKPVYKNELTKLICWDVPGINQDFSMFDPKNLGFFHSCDKIFVLYKDTPKRCEHIIKVLNQVKAGQIILVRTQCDTWDPSHQKTLAQELEADKQILRNWGIEPKAYYQHSSYRYGFDNDKIKAAIAN